MASSFMPRSHDASSSPLPSVDEIFSKITKPSTRTKNGFTSASECSGRVHSSTASFIRTEQGPVDLVTPRKPLPETIEPESDDSVCIIKIPVPGTKKGRRKKGSGKLRELKPKPKKSPAEEKPAGEKPWMKYRTSASPESKPKKKAAAATSTVRSHHFPTPVKARKDGDSVQLSRIEHEQILPPDEPLELIPALRRRIDWTPPPAGQSVPVSSFSSDIQELLSSAVKKPDAGASKEVFEKLLENYGRKEDPNHWKHHEAPEGIPEVLKKRKLVETASLDDSPAVPLVVSPAKKVSKRKKPRTITELATAAYAAPEEPQDPPSASLLSYLEQQTGGETAIVKGKAGRKATKGKRAKKAPEPAPILLSPSTAIRQVVNQDFVFGTSSQLAREHSPTLLRDLQTAVRASNMHLDEVDPFVTPLNSDAVEPPSRKKLWGVGARDDDGKLLDLEIINLVDTPVANVPDLGADSFGYLHGHNRTPATVRETTEVTDADHFRDRSLACGAPARLSLNEESNEKSLCLAASNRDNTGKVSDVPQQICTPPNSIHPSKPSKAPAVSLTLPIAPSPIVSQAKVVEDAPAGPMRPRYDLYTDAQLTKEITTFGFKPIKRRTAMIALLSQCWDSQNKPRIALSPLPSNQYLSTLSGTHTSSAGVKVPSEAPKRPRGRPRKNSVIEVASNEPPPSAQPLPPSPKRPRGRPRKDTGTTAAGTSAKSKSRAKPKVQPQASAKQSSAEESMSPMTTPSRRKASKARATEEIIEIPDSASDGSLLSPELGFSSPPAVDVSLSLDEDAEMSLAPAVTSTQSDLMDHITKAVQAAPPTEDPNEPSWHEKMLMYDPVILEDLAAWLNSGRLSEAGYDGEVSAFEVKQWCESKSVCCLWRVNVSGKERKRY